MASVHVILSDGGVAFVSLPVKEAWLQCVSKSKSEGVQNWTSSLFFLSFLLPPFGKEHMFVIVMMHVTGSGRFTFSTVWGTSSPSSSKISRKASSLRTETDTCNPGGRQDMDYPMLIFFRPMNAERHFTLSFECFSSTCSQNHANLCGLPAVSHLQKDTWWSWTLRPRPQTTRTFWLC